MTGKKIAVCHVASGDLWAGAEVQIATLLRMLARREEFELAAILLNRGRLADEIQACGIEVKIIPENEKSFPAIAREAAGFLESRGIQILHSHRYKENVLAAWLARHGRVPFVVRTQHGLAEPLRGIKHLKQRCIHGLDRWVARRATNRIIAVSAEMREHLARALDPRKIVVIPNGVDLAAVRSSLSAAEAKDRLGIPRDVRVLGAVGRLEPIKRLDIFLEAAKIISAAQPGARFVIAGDGRERAALENLAASLGISERVLFLGHRDNIYDVLRALDILVLSSDHEGLPMVLLEAMCLGVPVVARAVGGIPEVIVHNSTGVLVHSGEKDALAAACQDVLSDNLSAARIAQNAQKLVADKFSASATAAATARLYNDLVASPASNSVTQAGAR